MQQVKDYIIVHFRSLIFPPEDTSSEKAVVFLFLISPIILLLTHINIYPDMSTNKDVFL